MRHRAMFGHLTGHYTESVTELSEPLFEQSRADSVDIVRPFLREGSPMNAQTKPRQSRASRAAAAAEQDAIKAAESGEIEPTTEAAEQAAAQAVEEAAKAAAKPEQKPTEP